MALDPLQNAMFKPVAFWKGYSLTGYGDAPKGARAAEQYEHAMKFLDRIMEEAEARGMHLRDRLDAQGVLWSVIKAKPDWGLVKSWPSDEREEFLKWRGGTVDEDEKDGEGEGVEGSAGGKVARDALGALADKLFFESNYSA